MLHQDQIIQLMFSKPRLADQPRLLYVSEVSDGEFAIVLHKPCDDSISYYTYQPYVKPSASHPYCAINQLHSRFSVHNLIEIRGCLLILTLAMAQEQQIDLNDPYAISKGSQQGSDQQERPRKKLTRIGTLMRNILARSSADIKSVGPRQLQQEGASVSDPSTKLAVVLYCRLQNLPVEVLGLIRTQLDEVSAVCLKHTNQQLYRCISVTPPEERSRCIRWLIACRHEVDQALPRDSYTCAFCKQSRPEKHFTKFSFKQLMSDLPYCLDRRSIYSEPTARYCSFHPPLTAWLMYQVYEERQYTALRNEIRWVEVKQLRCMHCASAVDEETDLRETGCENCSCDVCPRVTGPAYIRYGPPANPNEFPRPPLQELNALTRKHRTYVRERGSKTIAVL